MTYNGWNGRPTIVEKFTYNVHIDEGKFQENFDIKEVYVFDRKGRLLKMTTYGSDETKAKKWKVYKYDKSGNIVQRKYFKKDSSSDFQINYAYNRYGQIVRQVTIEPYIRETVTYSYDRDRFTAVSQSIHEIGSVNKSVSKWHSMQQFDAAWKEIYSNEYNESGEVSSKWEFVYDDKGRQVLTRWYNPDLYYVYHSDYNEHGSETKVKMCRIEKGDTSHCTTTTYKLEYDNKNNCIVDTLSADGMPLFIYRYTFTY